VGVWQQPHVLERAFCIWDPAIDEHHLLAESILKPADVSPGALLDRSGHRVIADEITPLVHHRDPCRVAPDAKADLSRSPPGLQIRDQPPPPGFVLKLLRQRAGVDQKPVDLNDPGHRMLLEHRDACQVGLEDPQAERL
jgi:hypothetical protein